MGTRGFGRGVVLGREMGVLSLFKTFHHLYISYELRLYRLLIEWNYSLEAKAN